MSMITAAVLSKVLFLDVQESYDPAEPATFRYRFTVDLEPTAKDWIGLFRVGWKSTKDYVAYEWVNITKDFDPKKQTEFVCTFSGSLLQDDEDFFQLCYVDASGRVYGVSSPFQFLQDYDIVVINETESMLILESKSFPNAGRNEMESSQMSLLEELSSKSAETEELTEELKTVKKQLSEKDLEMEKLVSKVDQLTTELQQCKDKSYQLEDEVDLVKSKLSDEKETLIMAKDSLCKAKKDLQKALSEHSEKETMHKEKEKHLHQTIKDLQSQLCFKAQELELLKLEHSSVVGNLEAKQQAVDELTSRCNEMAAELTQRKMYETVIKNEEEEVLTTDGPEEMSSDAAGEAEIGRGITTASEVDHRQTYSTSSLKVYFTCPSCSLTFPENTPDVVINTHVESHSKMCPFCDQKFDLQCSQGAFEEHVYEHLVETRKLPELHKTCPVCHFMFPKEMLQSRFEDHVYQHFYD